VYDHESFFHHRQQFREDSALEKKICAHAVLSRTRAVYVVVAGPKQIQMIPTETEHRIGAHSCSDQARLRDGQVVALGNQVEILLEGLSDGFRNREWLIILPGGRPGMLGQPIGTFVRPCSAISGLVESHHVRTGKTKVAGKATA